MPPTRPGSDASAGSTKRPDTKSQCCVRRCRKNQRESRREFLPLPEGDRRVFWLKTLGRNDLLHVKDLSSYKICPKHYKRASIAEKYSRGTMGSPRIASQTGANSSSDAVTQTDPIDGREQATVKLDVPWYATYSSDFEDNLRKVNENKENQKF